MVVGGEDFDEACVGWGFTRGKDGGKGLICVSFHCGLLFVCFCLFEGGYEKEDCGKERSDAG